MKPSKLSVWLRLLWMFLKVNMLSPSGPASVGLLYKEAVGKIMSEERFVEAVGFSNVLPGSEALKLAMFVGYAAGGVPSTNGMNTLLCARLAKKGRKHPP